MLSKKSILLTAASVSLGLTGAAAHDQGHDAPKKGNPYVAGDMHNHNTCEDGSVSAGYSIDRSVGKGEAATGGKNFDLDWFTLGNHGGGGNRDCRFSSEAAKIPGDSVTKTWSETLGQTIDGITITQLKGTPSGSGTGARMWAWQAISEIEYPTIIDRTAKHKKVLVEGLEWVVPGHEHTDVAVIAGQRPEGGPKGFGSAENMAQFEYRFDRGDTDAIGPVDSAGASLWTGKDNTNNSGANGHNLKAVAAVEWLQANFPLESYAVPTHTERQGPFNAAGNNGYNIESYRDFNNAGPTVAFGIESPGHFAQNTSGGGTYGSGAVGGGTYGGIGIYNAKVGGLWDGMLGEGRNFFMYISSDWHSRGTYGAGEPYTTEDFFPGEFSKLYVPNADRFTRQSIIDGMRSGNSYSVSGDIIGPDLVFRAKGQGDGNDWKTMGETLVVKPGEKITLEMEMTIPAKNNSPYTFNNPLLAQVGIKQPLNKPSLDHVDLITGDITGVIAKTDPSYANGTDCKGNTLANARGADGAAVFYNCSAKIAQQIDTKHMKVHKEKDGSVHLSFTTTFKATNKPFYIRARGTNIPPATPFVTDSAGNALIDTTIAANVVCSDPACATIGHLQTIDGAKRVSYDLQGWANLWFYANPIFVRPQGTPKLLVEENAELAQQLAMQQDGRDHDHHGHGDHDGHHDYDGHRGPGNGNHGFGNPGHH